MIANNSSSSFTRMSLLFTVAACLVIVSNSRSPVKAQSLDFLRQEGRAMLSAIQVDIKKKLL